MAAKTGTTQNSADAWLAGYTPEYTAIVWVGNPSSNETVEIDGREVQGGSISAEIWHDFMVEALADVEPTAFPEPDDELLSGRRSEEAEQAQEEIERVVRATTATTRDTTSSTTSSSTTTSTVAEEDADAGTEDEGSTSSTTSPSTTTAPSTTAAPTTTVAPTTTAAPSATESAAVDTEGGG